MDVEVITLGTTLTPSLLRNLPGGPQGEAVMKIALTPEQVVEEAFEKLGKERSVIAGERNKASVYDWKANPAEDEYIRYMGSFYQNGSLLHRIQPPGAGPFSGQPLAVRKGR